MSMMLSQLSRLQVEPRYPFTGCSSSSTHSPAHKHFIASLDHHRAWKEASEEEHTELRRNSEEGIPEESGHGADPKLFHGNLGSPGYQPGAPLCVSNCKVWFLQPWTCMVTRSLFPFSVLRISLWSASSLSYGCYRHQWGYYGSSLSSVEGANNQPSPPALAVTVTVFSVTRKTQPQRGKSAFTQRV